MRKTGLIAVVLLCCLAGAGRSEESLVLNPYLTEVFDKGEKLVFTLSWLKVVGGSAEMTVTPLPESGKVRIQSIAQSNAFFSRIFRVRDEIESIVDRDDLSTVLFHKKLDERGRKKEEVTVIDEQRGIAVRKGVETRVPKPIFDPLSTIYYLRTLDLSPGKTYVFATLADGKLYTIEASVLHRETVRTDAGMFVTVLVEPKMRHGGIFRDENTTLQIWYTDDERRLPVRIRSTIPAGSITATLKSIGSTPVTAILTRPAGFEAAERAVPAASVGREATSFR